MKKSLLCLVKCYRIVSVRFYFRWNSTFWCFKGRFCYKHRSAIIRGMMKAKPTSLCVFFMKVLFLFNLNRVNLLIKPFPRVRKFYYRYCNGHILWKWEERKKSSSYYERQLEKEEKTAAPFSFLPLQRSVEEIKQIYTTTIIFSIDLNIPTDVEVNQSSY